MAEVLLPDEFRAAADRFRDFFRELSDSFVERDESLTQCALALLCREHVLMTGPPGTAKSQMSSAVLGRILDEETRAPSLFSTQFTENTVQTDLIGPINFKTLMASGRTEHFTDEGILGSVHAFLDEVFDGRDMLLRSALGVLKERELKHGSGVTRGRIESAFMTSNRYISEVLESARDTLLAFVDRIAFISFVPRGFAKEENLALVVRRHGGGFGRHKLSAPLTVQDLDKLQLATDMTYVPEPICNALARLVATLDDELADAKRSDPTFSPTRYLSTRTVVNAAKVLRAAVVYDKAFNNPKRDLQVTFDDLSVLRYYLMLSGLDPQLIPDRLEQETDPHERRQLEIMRTEAEIFDRCLAGVVRVKIPPPPQLDLTGLKRQVNAAKSTGDPVALAAAARQLIAATESGARGTDKAGALLLDTVSHLASRALKAGLTSDIQGQLVDAADDLVSVAAGLEKATGSGRQTAQWLRGRVLALLDEAASLAPSVSEESIAALVTNTTEANLAAQIEARLGSVESMFKLRRQLEAGGAWQPDPQRSAETWVDAVSKLESELALLLDSAFRLSAAEVLASDASLSDTLDKLRPIVDNMRNTVARVDAMAEDSELLQRVVGPRLEPLLASVFARMDGSDRRSVIAEVERVVGQLRSSGLDYIISPERFVEWSAPALLRAERERDGGQDAVTSRDAFDAALAREDALSVGEALVEIAVQASATTPLAPAKASDTANGIMDILRVLGDDTRQELISADLGRVERGVTALEQWWQHLNTGHDDAAEAPDKSVALLERVVQSGFLRVVRGDGPPLRLALEASRLAEVFPSCIERANRLRERIRSVDTTSADAMASLLQGHADRAWRGTLREE